MRRELYLFADWGITSYIYICIRGDSSICERIYIYIKAYKHLANTHTYAYIYIYRERERERRGEKEWERERERERTVEARVVYSRFCGRRRLFEWWTSSMTSLRRDFKKNLFTSSDIIVCSQKLLCSFCRDIMNTTRGKIWLPQRHRYWQREELIHTIIFRISGYEFLLFLLLFCFFFFFFCCFF